MRGGEGEVWRDNGDSCTGREARRGREAVVVLRGANPSCGEGEGCLTFTARGSD
jgi:hypothetical protein